MIKNKDLVNEINKILQDKTFTDIPKLSHFALLKTVTNEKLPFYFDINGNILDGEYKSYKITHVKTIKQYSWNKFIELCLKYGNYNENPCISTTLLYRLHYFNKIDILHMNTLIIQKNKEIKEIICEYKPIISNNISNIISKINKPNHFYFSSFDIDRYKDELHIEMSRLFKNRDSYKNIHIHLDNNGGGYNVPTHLLIRCLVGGHEKWMKTIKKKINDKIGESKCWNEDNPSHGHYKDFLKLNLEAPKYKTKYTGKIHLYISSKNASAAWYFITYMIYAFGSNIKRYTKKCYGQNLKFGTISKDSQLILHGYSATCSGDSNAIPINYKDIIIRNPRDQILSCSVKKNDWNRFWTE